MPAATELAVRRDWVVDLAFRTLSRRRLLAGGAVAILAGGSAYALRGGARMQRRPAADGKTLNRGNGAEPGTLDPHMSGGSWEYNIIADMFVGLMTQDAAGNAIFGAAESFSPSEDGLTYTFKLRDHTWSDGVKVTAHDFVYSFRRLLDPKTAADHPDILYPLKNAEAVNKGKLPPESLGVRAIDDRTLEIACHFQVPYIAQLMTHPCSYPVPRHAAGKHGANWTHPGHIAANGPYMLTEWVSNDHIKLVKNPRYYDRGSVKIDTVYYYPTPDAAAALKRFRAGEFDVVTDSVPPQQVRWLKKEIPGELRTHPLMETWFVLFNLNKKPFNDMRVRTALSLAIDREIIAEKVTRAGQTPAYALVPPHMPNYPGKAALKFKSLPMAARLAMAKTLLKEAGFSAGNPLRFAYATKAITEAKIVAVALQEMWREIGAEVQITYSESAVHYDLVGKGDFDAAWIGLGIAYLDAKDFLTMFQSSNKFLSPGNYTDSEYDALMERSDMERDPAVRAGLLQQAEQHMLDDMAIAPIFFGATRDMVSTDVRGWIDNNLDVHPSRYLSLVRSRADA